MIDLHFHCLPRVDDGPASWDEAVALCRAAAAEGTTRIVATPHVLRGSWTNTNPVARERLVQALNERLGPPAFREIVLRIGPVQAMPTRPDPGPLAPEPERPLDPETSGRIEELLSPVQDAPFAEALRRLLQRSARSRERGPSPR